MVRPKERESKAVGLFIKHLGRTRGISYQRVSQPDKSERSRPAADFVYREGDSDRLVAVEYTEFTDPKVAEASALMGDGKTLRRQGPNEVRPIEIQGEQVGFIEPSRSYPGDLSLLDKFIAEKIEKGQLQATAANERILLVYDATLMPETSLSRYQCRLKPAERDNVDSTFVIFEQRHLYQLW